MAIESEKLHCNCITLQTLTCNCIVSKTSLGNCIANIAFRISNCNCTYGKHCISKNFIAIRLKVSHCQYPLHNLDESNLEVLRKELREMRKPFCDVSTFSTTFHEATRIGQRLAAEPELSATTSRSRSRVSGQSSSSKSDFRKRNSPIPITL